MLSVDILKRKSVFFQVVLGHLDYVCFSHYEFESMERYKTLAISRGLEVIYYDSEVCVSVKGV